MILSRLALAAALSLTVPLSAGTVRAETVTADPVAEVSVANLGEVMQFGPLFDVLREEGLMQGGTLAADMLPEGGGAGWQAELAGIYDMKAVRGRFDAALAGQLGADPGVRAEIVAFLGSDLGQRILGLEIEARRAFLDTAAEEAAQVAAEDAAGAKDPKAAQIRRMIEAGDLLEMNVAGSLTGSLAFMTGIADSGAYGANLPDEQLRADTWAQEDETRADLSTWLYSYLGLAYAPLTEAELESYVAFWESPAGKRLNAALFAAFDQAFRPISYDLGHATGTAMQGRDI